MSQELSAVIKLIHPHINCFFSCDCGFNWCTGQVVATIRLPMTNYSNEFVLVCDIGYELHWIAANRVKYTTIPNNGISEIKDF